MRHSCRWTLSLWRVCPYIASARQECLPTKFLLPPKNQNVMKCLRKQTNCSVFADFRDATFAQSGPNSGFCAIFLHKTGLLCKVLSASFTFLERSDEKFRGRNAKFRAPEFFFRGSKFLFRGSDGKIPVQKLFRGGSGGVFLSRWNFFPDTFPLSFCRRNPPTGFPAGRLSAPGVSRVPSKGKVGRGFRDILISARRVWLRSFRAVPSRRPNTRISEGENEQIVNAHPNVSLYII